MRRPALTTSTRRPRLLFLSEFLESYARAQLIFLVPALLSLRLKIGMMEQDRFAIKRWAWLSPSDYWPYLPIDLCIGLIVVPLVATILTSFCRPAWKWTLLAVSSALMVLVLFIEQRAVSLLGTFAPMGEVWEGLRWGVRNMGLASQYLSALSFVKLLFSLGGVVLCWRLAGWSRTMERLISLKFLRWAWLTAQLIILVAPSVVPARDALHKRSILSQIWSAQLPDGGEAPLPLATLCGRYARLAAAPAPEAGRTYFGAAHGYDVILFVMETVPARCLDLGVSDLGFVPAMARLRERAWIATQYFSTYPMTPRAFYSILTSMYPPDPPIGYVTIGQENGLLRILRSRGYSTAVYGFGFADFEELPRGQAVDKLVTCPNKDLSLTGAWTLQSGDWLKAQVVSDEQCLDSMLGDLSQWIRSGHRYAVVYAPQSTHAPWQSPRAEAVPRAPLERCRDLVALQDSWLGKTVDLLQREGRLEKTLIVVTADHGIRTRTEDPSFRNGFIDDYSFHVPLLFYAPAVLEATAEISWVTSHIDIQPSILDLLGVREGRELEQGTAIWNQGLARRATFFWAERYLGADGFHQNGKFFMWSRLHDTVYAGDRLEFRDADRVAPKSPLFDGVRNEISSMDLLRRSWLRCAREGCPESGPK